MVALLILFVALASSTFPAHNTTAACWEKSQSGGDAARDATCAQARNERNLEAIEVLVAGASRTGTSSMEFALQKLGYHTTHWQGYMIRYFDFIFHAYQGAISEPDLHQVFQDIPGKGALLDAVVPMLFDNLRKAYPKAKVILTTREPTSWLKSYEQYVDNCWLYQPSTRHPAVWMLSHVSRALRLGSFLRYCGITSNPSNPSQTGLDLDLLPELSEVFRKSDEVIYESWIPSPSHVEKRKLYEEHVKATVPQEQLLVFDASAGDTFRKLVTFLNASVPADLDVDHFPKLFDEKSLKTHGMHSQIVKHNVVLLGTATLSVIFMTVLTLKLWAICLSALSCEQEECIKSPSPAKAKSTSTRISSAVRSRDPEDGSALHNISSQFIPNCAVRYSGELRFESSSASLQSHFVCRLCID
eukprot:s5166_g4.t1